MVNEDDAHINDEDDAHKNDDLKSNIITSAYFKNFFFYLYDIYLFKYLMWILNTIVQFTLSLKICWNKCFSQMNVMTTCVEMKN